MDIQSQFYVYEYHRAKASKYGAIDSPYYVGKGKGNRRFDQEHRAKPPRDRAYNIIVKEGLTEQEAFAEEIRLIALYGRIDLGTGCLRNLTDGGDGCGRRIISPEAREKQRQAILGRKHSLATREKMRISSPRPNLGKKMSVESRDKLRIAKLGNQVQLGKVRSAESKERMRLAHVGKPRSKETKAKLRIANTGKVLTQEHKDKITEAAKRRYTITS